MKAALKILAAVIILTFANTAAAESTYPPTLEDGNLILIDGGMGVGRYADKKSVAVQVYKPPFYQLSIDCVDVLFSNEYYREHDTYIGGPYAAGDWYTLNFKYNWDVRTIFRQNERGIWQNWDINRSYSHAEGNPLIPNAAEVAFVAAYGMKFFGDKKNDRGYPVIDYSLYSALGI